MAVMQSKCISLCLSAMIQEAFLSSSPQHDCVVHAAALYPAGLLKADELHTCTNLLPNSMHAIKPTNLS